MSMRAGQQGACGRIAEPPLTDRKRPMPASVPWLALRRSVAACYAVSYAMLRALAWWARDVYRFMVFPCSQRRGVYRNFRQAEAAVLPTTRIGFDHADLARQYRAELNFRLDNSEYPLLYYLERILTSHSTVLDFGGNIGVHYLRLRNHVALDMVRWIVCDVPAITHAGRMTCADIPNVEFINDIDELDCVEIDVFLTSSCLQYVETQDSLLPRLLERGTRPRHLLLDHLPLYDGPRFVTLQNGGLVCYPHYVFNRADYISAIANLGYALVNSWDCGNDSCIIPFHREKTVCAYSGLYFSRRPMTDQVT